MNKYVCSILIVLFSFVSLFGEQEMTCAIIKPDAVEAGTTGEIISIIENNGFKIIRLEKITLSREAAEIFYSEHQDKPFFTQLIDFMISGPIVVMALSRENAVRAWRNLIGATNPKKAKKQTIRASYGSDIAHNAVHGSDSQERAWWELVFFFMPQDEFVEDTLISQQSEV